MKMKEVKKVLKRKIKPNIRAYLHVGCPYCYRVNLIFSMNSIFDKNCNTYYCEECERVFSLSLKEEKPNPAWLKQLHEQKKRKD